MTALFRTRLEQHGSGNLGDAVGGGVRRGRGSNLLGASLPCSQQSASINKGLAAPRSILIFKLTAERIRAFPLSFSLATEREKERKKREIERETKRERERERLRGVGEFTLELARVYVSVLSVRVSFCVPLYARCVSVCVCAYMRVYVHVSPYPRSRSPPRGRVCTHSDRNSDRHRTGCRYTWNLIINKCERG